MAGDNHEGIKGFRMSFNISCISGKNLYCYILKKKKQAGENWGVLQRAQEGINREFLKSRFRTNSGKV